MNRYHHHGAIFPTLGKDRKDLGSTHRNDGGLPFSIPRNTAGPPQKNKKRRPPQHHDTITRTIAPIKRHKIEILRPTEAHLDVVRINIYSTTTSEQNTQRQGGKEEKTLTNLALPAQQQRAWKWETKKPQRQETRKTPTERQRGRLRMTASAHTKTQAPPTENQPTNPHHLNFQPAQMPAEDPREPSVVTKEQSVKTTTAARIAASNGPATVAAERKAKKNQKKNSTSTQHQARNKTNKQKKQRNRRTRASRMAKEVRPNQWPPKAPRTHSPPNS